MSEALFRQIGPYEISGRIGRGMASVFLATDTRPGGGQVALKVIADGPDDDARETAEAERRGAALQRQWLSTSRFVPEVYEIGSTTGYLYIAMEYIEGEDLSALIRRGPIEPHFAGTIATQLCLFLEEIDHLDLGTEGGSPLTLLHNDLKPTNIRIVAGNQVKVLDFGAAKALSMSRRVTRNDFYSTPYLSPECLESGERDRQTDAWALGVILYEMVAGRPPFRADDTRRLEDRIRSRRPPDPPDGCPVALQAIIAKLLAPNPSDRYEDPTAAREDLDRFEAGEQTTAEREGWPGKPLDEPPTRRVQPASDDEPPTRRTRVVDAGSITAADAAVHSTAPHASSPPRRYWVRVALLLGLLSLGANEACVMRQARSVAARVPTQELNGLTATWSEYQALRSRSYFGFGANDLKRALQRQTLVLAERVAANYRTPTPTVREAQWSAAAKALERALTLEPDSAEIRGTLRYAEGHLHRIDGEAERSRHQTVAAQRHFAEAVAAFREAATLRPTWPDPFLGLARTFIYGLEDIDRGADSLTQAQKLGYTPGARETAQLADGYRVRGAALFRAATTVNGLPQERELLTRAREAFQTALDHYAKIADMADVPPHIRTTQGFLTVIDRKIAELDARQPDDGDRPVAVIVGPRRGAARSSGQPPWA